MADGISIDQTFGKLSGVVGETATTLNQDIEAALTKGELDPIEMLGLQFSMGKFNALIEATSSVTKGLVDTAKTLAQRAGG